MQDDNVALRVQDLHKSYAGVKAVDGLSFELRHGEIFGLLGPNGAGKTSSIRMILDIIKPDSGQIEVLGGPMQEEKKGRIGYLPEERGLYEDMTLLDTLLFLGQLKGLSISQARDRAEKYLRIVELWDVRDRKIEALSRGMGQKAQFVAATMHEPELIIVDEPFSGLDPINTRIIKSLLNSLRDGGAAIIMSTHQMNRVEEMCSRIMLIDNGRRVLYGGVQEIRKRYAPHAVEVEIEGEFPDLAEIAHLERINGAYRLLLKEGVEPAQVLKALANEDTIQLKRFEELRASLEEIFVKVVGRDTLEQGEPA
jgi:ABC-2 type transport system ATP-binding protein